jgi:hypothetical protein
MRQNELSRGGLRIETLRLHRRNVLSGRLAALSARTARGLLAASLLMGVGLSAAGGAPQAALAAPVALDPSATTITVNDYPPSDDGLVHFKLIPGASEAKYTLQIALPFSQPKPTSCTTRDVSGDIVMNPDGTIIPELSKITVDMRNLTCQSPLSPARAQQVMETNKFPLAEFNIQQAPGLTLPVPDGQVTTLSYFGDQTVHGVTRPVEYAGSSVVNGGESSGSSSTTIKMSDFGMTPPSIPGVQVADEMVVGMTFKAAVSGPPQAVAEGE